MTPKKKYVKGKITGYGFEVQTPSKYLPMEHTHFKTSAAALKAAKKTTKRAIISGKLPKTTRKLNILIRENIPYSGHDAWGNKLGEQRCVYSLKTTSQGLLAQAKREGIK